LPHVLRGLAGNLEIRARPRMHADSRSTGPCAVGSNWSLDIAGHLIGARAAWRVRLKPRRQSPAPASVRRGHRRRAPPTGPPAARLAIAIAVLGGVLLLLGCLCSQDWPCGRGPICASVLPAAPASRQTLIAASRGRLAPLSAHNFSQSCSAAPSTRTFDLELENLQGVWSA